MDWQYCTSPVCTAPVCSTSLGSSYRCRIPGHHCPEGGVPVLGLGVPVLSSTSHSFPVLSLPSLITWALELGIWGSTHAHAHVLAGLSRQVSKARAAGQMPTITVTVNESGYKDVVPALACGASPPPPAMPHWGRARPIWAMNH